MGLQYQLWWLKNPNWYRTGYSVTAVSQKSTKSFWKGLSDKMQARQQSKGWQTTVLSPLAAGVFNALALYPYCIICWKIFHSTVEQLDLGSTVVHTCVASSTYMYCITVHPSQCHGPVLWWTHKCSTVVQATDAPAYLFSRPASQCEVHIPWRAITQKKNVWKTENNVALD